VDVWSVGALLFEALTGFQPFLADSAADMVVTIATKQGARNASGVPDFIACHKLSADCEDFLVSALTWDAGARPTASQLMAHRWMQRYLGRSPVSSSPSRRRSREARKSGDMPDGGAAAAAAMGVLQRTTEGSQEGAGGEGGAGDDGLARRGSEGSSEGEAPALKRAVTDMSGMRLPSISRLRSSVTSKRLT
jgi:serine/threonine protein kinase